ncbi:unnamed protein product, partial [Closterium sp. NIES-53]
WIEDNKLTGPLPTEIGNCTSLQILYLSNNSISGSLPDSIGQLWAMRDMRLDSNMLSGALPPTMGLLSNLTVLELHSNQLSGALPATLGKLSLLKALTINATAQPCPASTSPCLVSQSASSSFCHLCPQFCSSCEPLEGLTVENGGESGNDGSGGNGGGLSMGAIIAVVCGSLLLLTAVLVAFLIWCCCGAGSSPFKHVKVVDQEEFDDAGLIPSLCCRYSLVEIRRATGNWSEENRIGSGQHSDVYKGTCPYNPASTWAVKRYKERSNHFEKEVEQIASKWHPNLAHLLGYCVDSDTRVEGGRMVQVEEQIAVYEYVHHGDLSRYLYQETFRASFALWERVDILIGMAHGVQYLHSVGMVHGDLKPANILIDKSWQAKVANYGLLQRNETSAVNAGRLFGTPGYVDPVYLTSHIATKASDVFSFGVIFLELLTGRPPFIQVQAEHGEDHEHIADWAAPLIDEGKTEELKDPHLDVPESSFLSMQSRISQFLMCAFLPSPFSLLPSPFFHLPSLPIYQAAPLIDEGQTEELKDPHVDVPESSFLHALAYLSISHVRFSPFFLLPSSFFHLPSLPTNQAAPLIDEGKTEELKDPHVDVPESSFLHALAYLSISHVRFSPFFLLPSSFFHLPSLPTNQAVPLIDEGKTEELKDPHVDVPESSFLHALAYLSISHVRFSPFFLLPSSFFHLPSLPTNQAAPLIDEGKTEELKDPHLDVPESSFLSLAELAIRCTAMPFTDRPPMGEVLATLKAIRTDFFGLTDPDEVYGGEGSGGMENGFSGGDGDGDGRGDWGVSVNNI